MKKFLVLVLILLAGPGLHARALQGPGQPSAPSQYSKYPFLYITRDTVTVAPVFTDEEFYKLSSTIIFKVNEVHILDDQFLRLYNDEILPRLNSDHMQLRKIYIRGAASPEGPYANNKWLGQKRAETLVRELRKNLGSQYVQFDTQIENITEDYGFLCILMEEAGDADYAKVKAIYDAAQGSELKCKKALMAADGGRLWKRLLKEYFPKLRSARVVMWFSEADKEHAPLPKMAGIESRAIAPIGALAQPYIWQEPVQEEPQWTRRHLIALRTNLVHDFFYMPKFGFAPSPNLQLEYYPLDGHWTYNLGMTWGTWRKWDQHKFWQIRDFQFEARRYFKGGGQFTGLYLGGYLHGDVYGIGLADELGWQGEGGGLGVSLGYVLPLTRKGDLRLEFMLGVGAFFSWFDPYVYGNPVTGDIDGDYYYNYLGSASDFKRRNHFLQWYGPTNLGIQLTYDIIYRKRKQVK